MIKFVNMGFWDKRTMAVDDAPTPEQSAQVDKICHDLSQKYYTDKVCPTHPDKVQRITAYLRNGLLSLLVAPDDTCRCYDAKMALNKIADAEEQSYNQGQPNLDD